MHFEPTQKNISDFFYNEHKIPFHQRSYIWSAEVLKEFWEDIHYVHENRHEKYMHFLGSIITTKIITATISSMDNKESPH